MNQAKPARSEGSQKLLDRASDMMRSLWFPAVLGSALVLFIERWAIENSHAAMMPSTWLGLLLILYFSILYSESKHSHEYSWVTWVVDLIDIPLMYAAFLCLGFGLGSSLASPNWAYGWMGALFAEPILWRRMKRHREWPLDLFCIAFIALMLCGAFLLPATHDLYITGVAWVLLLVYIGYVIYRALCRGHLPAGV